MSDSDKKERDEKGILKPIHKELHFTNLTNPNFILQDIVEILCHTSRQLYELHKILPTNLDR